MDRWTDQQTHLLIEMQFYISVMFPGLPDNIQEKKPFFSTLKITGYGLMDQLTDGPTNGWTDGWTDPLMDI